MFQVDKLTITLGRSGKVEGTGRKVAKGEGIIVCVPRYHASETKLARREKKLSCSRKDAILLNNLSYHAKNGCYHEKNGCFFFYASLGGKSRSGHAL